MLQCGDKENKMLNLELQVSEIIKNDPRLRDEIDNKYVELLHDEEHPNRIYHTLEWYEEMDFMCYGEPVPLGCERLQFRIYADALREFGCMIFTNDLMTGLLYLEWTRQTVTLLVSQYGLRNVTNEFAKQIAKRLNITIIK